MKITEQDAALEKIRQARLQDAEQEAALDRIRNARVAYEFVEDVATMIQIDGDVDFSARVRV